MKKQICTSAKSVREQIPDFSPASKQGMFQERSLGLHPKRIESTQQADFKTSLMQAERYGHSISGMMAEVSSGVIQQQTKYPSRPVQMARKRANSVPETKTIRENLDAQRPQLTKSGFKSDFARETADLADDVITGRKHGRGGQSLGFHVTKEKHLPSIKATGLDPNKGGEGGASAKRQVAESEVLTIGNNKGVTGEGTNYVNESKGKVHFSDNTYSSGYYASQMLDDKPTVLGIRRPRTIERDPDDPRGAYRTNQLIPPSDITNLGQGVAKEAVANKETADARFSEKLKKNIKDKREFNLKPIKYKLENKAEIKRINEEGAKLHKTGRAVTAPEPLPDESVPLGEKRRVSKG